MRWQVAALGALALACFACRSPSEEAAPAAPRIAFAETTHDFGQVEHGTPVTHAFAFRNSGGSNLMIDAVRAACACTATVLAGTLVAPGETGSIQTTLDTAAVSGRTRKTVTVYSSDPAQPVTTLVLTGEVTADAVADPPRLYVARLGRGRAAPRDVRVVLRNGVAIAGVDAPGTVIAVSRHDLDGDARGLRLSVAVKDDAPLGRFAETLTVRTTSPRLPAVAIPVVGIVEGDVSAAPPRLAFGTVARGASASRLLVVKNDGARPVRIRAVRLSLPWAEAAVDTVREGGEYRVTVTLRGDAPVGPVRAAVEVETDHPEQPLLSVPVTAMVKVQG